MHIYNMKFQHELGRMVFFCVEEAERRMAVVEFKYSYEHLSIVFLENICTWKSLSLSFSVIINYIAIFVFNASDLNMCIKMVLSIRP